MNDRGLVEVPENAVRDEPIAFGLTGVQLGICGIAVLVAAALNLLPIWEPVRIALIVFVAGPIAVGAALPIQGEPAYRWLFRAVRYARAPRRWAAQLEGDKVVTMGTANAADKRLISGADYADGSPDEAPNGAPAWPVEDNTDTAPQRTSSPISEAATDESPGRRTPASRQVVMADGQLLRPHSLRPEDDGSEEPPPTWRRSAASGLRSPTCCPGYGSRPSLPSPVASARRRSRSRRRP